MLTELTVKDFLNKVAGSDPVPGGGSIAALNGALASALAAMVANLTIGKKKYAEVQEDMQAIAQEAEELMTAFTADIDRDSDAYDRVFACFKMPKDTDEEKVARSTAIQEATKYAAQVPLEVARRACTLMPRIAEVALKGNQNAVTDACVAMMSARNAVLAAVLNVRINLTSLKDAELVARLQAEADGLEQQACNQEQELLAKIKALLNA
ncbi:methenyltetrahydrofolate cyclohydrolase [Bacteroidales bacterium SW292]|jgi:formiminotetrahydrofolate cyclodeaminase|uniref:cyclodeaminase/cyclohydrolase family protein n=1 Tax=Mediterranea sp. An20 TaxID=1965586 RepID=UPI000B38D7CD|nr:cyclodeaminase/cyclohydrolase family protein [Mediterranea sp. An20]MBW9203015.1 methenyltetrahydrofolate cyclohydrolase [Bacteroidales bacterium SW292]OUP11389.1 methenyltetrahydrofolate cyclohydrolase [Mediterranea sp. An20]